MKDLEFSFVITIFFLLLGPIKIIQPFARLTRSAEPRFKQNVALRAALCATVICAAVFLLAENFVANYHLSVPALQIAAGLILLISALNLIFPRPQGSATAGKEGTAFQLALSPLATPVIVTPARVAAIMVFVLARPAVCRRLSDHRPGFGPGDGAELHRHGL
jgi:multiple antibiotic resistance protein